MCSKTNYQTTDEQAENETLFHDLKKSPKCRQSDQRIVMHIRPF